jgi:hypothetical protein
MNLGLFIEGVQGHRLDAPTTKFSGSVATVSSSTLRPVQAVQAKRTIPARAVTSPAVTFNTPKAHNIRPARRGLVCWIGWRPTLAHR